jgi:hypothetical protein
MTTLDAAYAAATADNWSRCGLDELRRQAAYDRWLTESDPDAADAIDS